MKRPPGRRPIEPRLWTHELEYQAANLDEPRRVVLVVKERPDDPLLDRFFLVTSISRFQMNGQALLEHSRQRGKAEGHMGELMDVLAPALTRAEPTRRAQTGLPDLMPTAEEIALVEEIFPELISGPKPLAAARSP